MKLSDELELEAGYQDEFDHCVVRDKLKNLANNAKVMEDRIEELEECLSFAKEMMVCNDMDLPKTFEKIDSVLKGGEQ